MFLLSLHLFSLFYLPFLARHLLVSESFERQWKIYFQKDKNVIYSYVMFAAKYASMHSLTRNGHVLHMQIPDFSSSQCVLNLHRSSLGGDQLLPRRKNGRVHTRRFRSSSFFCSSRRRWLLEKELQRGSRHGSLEWRLLGVLRRS